MLHLRVYCVTSAVWGQVRGEHRARKTRQWSLPRPPGPRGEVPGQLHCRHHKQSRDHWTELYPGDSVNSEGIFVFLTFLDASISP